MFEIRTSIEVLPPHGAPGELTLRATLRNTGNQPLLVNRARLACASLALEVRDPTDATVPLSPPPVPNERLRAPGDELGPGADLTVDYTNFLDRDLQPGVYRVRFKGLPSADLSRQAATSSEWIELNVTRLPGGFPVGQPVPIPKQVPMGLFGDWIRRTRRWLSCFIQRILGLQCDSVFEQEVSEGVTQTISNAPTEHPEYNAKSFWYARFHVRVDEAQCRVTVTVRVRLVGTITIVQMATLKDAIEAKWNGRFKLCCSSCCCGDGYAIVTDVQFVETGEHLSVFLNGTTTDRTHWVVKDPTGITHEFGHLLGAKDEYYTVDGIDYGQPNRLGAGVMNNPADLPLARHYRLVRDAARGLLRTPCLTVAQGDRC